MSYRALGCFAEGLHGIKRMIKYIHRECAAINM